MNRARHLPLPILFGLTVSGRYSASLNLCGSILSRSIQRRRRALTESTSPPSKPRQSRSAPSGISSQVYIHLMDSLSHPYPHPAYLHVILEIFTNTGTRYTYFGRLFSGDQYRMQTVRHMSPLTGTVPKTVNYVSPAFRHPAFRFFRNPFSPRVRRSWRSRNTRPTGISLHHHTNILGT